MSTQDSCVNTNGGGAIKNTNTEQKSSKKGGKRARAEAHAARMAAAAERRKQKQAKEQAYKRFSLQLYTLAKSGTHDQMRSLIKEIGTDINIIHDALNTALIHALENKGDDAIMIMHILVDAGATVDASGEQVFRLANNSFDFERAKLDKKINYEKFMENMGKSSRRKK